MLAFDTDSYVSYPLFIKTNAPLSIILGMGASTLGGMCFSTFINGKPIIRDATHSVVAGGIVVGAASFFITNPVYAVVAGFSAGSIQALIQNIF